MTVRRLLVVAVIAVGTIAGFAPAADAEAGVCAWVDPNGVCISNPFTGLPRLPRP